MKFGNLLSVGHEVKHVLNLHLFGTGSVLFHTFIFHGIQYTVVIDTLVSLLVVYELATVLHQSIHGGGRFRVYTMVFYPLCSDSPHVIILIVPYE